MTTLAHYSNLALYGSMAVYTLAMLGFAVYLTALAPRQDLATEDARDRDTERQKALVGARSGAQLDDAVTPTSTGSGRAASSVTDTMLEKVGGKDRPSKAAQAGSISMSLTYLATGLLIASVVMRGVAVGRWPLGNMFEFGTFSCAVVMSLFLAWSIKHDVRWLGIFLVAPVLLVLGMASTVWYTEAAELMPSLRSYWLVIHVTVATISVALFTIGAALSVLYLVQLHTERTGSPAFMLRLPPSGVLERTSYGIYVIAFPLWTFTLIAGAIWARQAWGSYWNWDPKEVWTFIIWVIYAAYLHARATRGWSRAQATYVALAGFAAILINYGIVNIYFVSQHSYSGL